MIRPSSANMSATKRGVFKQPPSRQGLKTTRGITAESSPNLCAMDDNRQSCEERSPEEPTRYAEETVYGLTLATNCGHNVTLYTSCGSCLQASFSSRLTSPYSSHVMRQLTSKSCFSVFAFLPAIFDFDYIVISADVSFSRATAPPHQRAPLSVAAQWR